MQWVSTAITSVRFFSPAARDFRDSRPTRAASLSKVGTATRLSNGLVGRGCFCFCWNCCKCVPTAVDGEASTGTVGGMHGSATVTRPHRNLRISSSCRRDANSVPASESQSGYHGASWLMVISHCTWAISQKQHIRLLPKLSNLQRDQKTEAQLHNQSHTRARVHTHTHTHAHTHTHTQALAHIYSDAYSLTHSLTDRPRQDNRQSDKNTLGCTARTHQPLKHSLSNCGCRYWFNSTNSCRLMTRPIAGEFRSEREQDQTIPMASKMPANYK